MKRITQHPLTLWIFRKRFMKFATVGASGVVVNLVVLYLCREFLFAAIHSTAIRLNAALAVAIFVATVNNFYWNRFWTWGDRTHHRDKHLVLHFGQYALACWVGMLVQVVLTNLFVIYIHYLIANALAIVIASFFNFLVNNFWTFRSHQPVEEIALPVIPEPDVEEEAGSR